MAKGVARTGQDSAGGTIEGLQVPNIIVNGTPIAVVGDAVAGHGKPPHAAPVMAEGFNRVLANGIPICREGDAASCGDTATGSNNVFSG